MQLAVFGHTFNGYEVCAIRLDREHRAGLHCQTIAQDRAGAADAGLAADVRAGQIAVIAQEMRQQQAWFNFVVMLNAVDDDFDNTFHRNACTSFVRPQVTESL